MISYDTSPWPVRADVVAAHRRAWGRLARPGTWFTGAERLAIAIEARQALDCRLCAARKAALSPNAVAGIHDTRSDLRPAQVEAIHRIRTDPGRLTRAWYRDRIAGGLAEEEYVELVGVVVTTVAVDSFCRALGLPLHDLPAPVDGEPSRHRPSGVVGGRAWVPMLPPKSAAGSEADLYEGNTGAHVRQAMSLVPDEVRGFFDLVETQYLPAAAMRDFASEPRAITHAQIELIAGRVSALNQCVY